MIAALGVVTALAASPLLVLYRCAGEVLVERCCPESEVAPALAFDELACCLVEHHALAQTPSELPPDGLLLAPPLPSTLASALSLLPRDLVPPVSFDVAPGTDPPFERLEILIV